MPTGPKGEKRPADVIGAAIKVARIATGEESEDLGADDGKDPAARALGKKGGAARAKAMTPERRAEIAKTAAESAPPSYLPNAAQKSHAKAELRGGKICPKQRMRAT